MIFPSVICWRELLCMSSRGKILEVPEAHWRKHLAKVRHHPSERLSFMTDEHHRVRNFVVLELPRHAGEPLSPEAIAERLRLPLATVVAILDDLQKNLFFLVRNTAGQVSWAFPVTSEKTAHRLRFSSGEYTFAA